MENNIFLDKVVGFLVRDTKMDYEKDEIQFPFSYSPDSCSRPYVLLPLFYLPPHRLLLFSEYCKNVYGLTEQEIEYVWDQYRTIIIDKIENGR